MAQAHDSPGEKLVSISASAWSLTWVCRRRFCRRLHYAAGGASPARFSPRAGATLYGAAGIQPARPAGHGANPKDVAPIDGADGGSVDPV
jgi:hypothetical protein